jgi:hypothetical protein
MRGFGYNLKMIIGGIAACVQLETLSTLTKLYNLQYLYDEELFKLGSIFAECKGWIAARMAVPAVSLLSKAP